MKTTTGERAYDCPCGYHVVAMTVDALPAAVAWHAKSCDQAWSEVTVRGTVPARPRDAIDGGVASPVDMPALVDAPAGVAAVLAERIGELDPLLAGPPSAAFSARVRVSLTAAPRTWQRSALERLLRGRRDAFIVENAADVRGGVVRVRFDDLPAVEVAFGREAVCSRDLAKGRVTWSVDQRLIPGAWNALPEASEPVAVGESWGSRGPGNAGEEACECGFYVSWLDDETARSEMVELWAAHRAGCRVAELTIAAPAGALVAGARS